MTTTRHTPIATGAAANAATLNAPLSELDTAIVAVESDVTELMASVGSGAGWASTLDAQALSGQKVVPVASTTGAIAGMPIYIGLTSGTHEVGVIDTISAGVSVTLLANLASTYAAGTPISATPAEVADARGTGSTLGARLDRAARTSLLAPGRKWGFMGDSITNGSSASVSLCAFTYQACYIAGAAYASPVLLVEAGEPGNTTASMLARFRADIIDTGCEAVVILGGTNDAGSSVAVGTFASNMAAMFELAKEAGLPVVAVTVPPRGAAVATATTRQLGAGYNAWLRLVAPGYGVQVADAEALMIDPTTGDLLAACASGDGVHPNNLGHARIAKSVAAAMKLAMGSRAGFVAGKSALNLVPNPIMAGTPVAYDVGAGVDGVVPPNWDIVFTTHSHAHPVASVVADTSGELLAGSWLQLDWTSTESGLRRWQIPLSGGWSDGDVIAATARFQVEDVAGGLEAAAATAAGLLYLTVLKSTMAGFGSWQGGSAVGPDLGPAWLTATIPAGATTLYLWISILMPANLHVKFRVGEVGVFNLTALGLTAQT